MRSKGKIRLGITLVAVCALSFVSPGQAGAQTPPDDVDLGPTNDQLGNTWNQAVGEVDAQEVVDSTLLNFLGGTHCRTVAQPPVLSGPFVEGQAEHQCLHSHVTTTIVARLMVRIAGEWHQFGPERGNATVNDTSASQSVSNGCIDGTFRYQTRGRGEASGTVDEHFDKDKAGATLFCDYGVSPEEFLSSLN